MKNELILENFLPYRLSILSNTVSSTIATAYNKRFGLSIPEWRVIAVLGRFPGLSAVEVAERTLMDKVAVSRAVTKLINADRINRPDRTIMRIALHLLRTIQLPKSGFIFCVLGGSSYSVFLYQSLEC